MTQKKNLALKDISAAAKNLAELSKYENGKVFIVRNKDTKKRRVLLFTSRS